MGIFQAASSFTSIPSRGIIDAEHSQKGCKDGNSLLYKIDDSYLDRCSDLGAGSSRFVSAYKALEQLGREVSGNPKVQQGGIGGVLASSPFGWQDDVRFAIRDRFGIPVSSGGVDLQGRDTHAFPVC